LLGLTEVLVELFGAVGFKVGEVGLDADGSGGDEAGGDEQREEREGEAMGGHGVVHVVGSMDLARKVGVWIHFRMQGRNPGGGKGAV